MTFIFLIILQQDALLLSSDKIEFIYFFVFFLFFQAAKEAKARIPPWEMFKHETDKYSKFDEQVRIIK